jgi:hypothetical protein
LGENIRSDGARARRVKGDRRLAGPIKAKLDTQPIDPDEYAALSEASLPEWDSTEDEAVYRDLLVR